MLCLLARRGVRSLRLYAFRGYYPSMGSTYFLAQLIGLLLLSVGASMLFQKTVFMNVLNDVTGDRTSLFMVGVILLLSGLSVVLTHNIWNSGFLPLVITLIGWVLILRGILSMFVPGRHRAYDPLVKGGRILLALRHPCPRDWSASDLGWIHGLIYSTPLLHRI